MKEIYTVIGIGIRGEEYFKGSFSSIDLAENYIMNSYFLCNNGEKEFQYEDYLIFRNTIDNIEENKIVKAFYKNFTKNGHELKETKNFENCRWSSNYPKKMKTGVDK